MQHANDAEEITQMKQQISSLRQPQQLQQLQTELRDVKARLYDVINLCQRLLIKKGIENQDEFESPNEMSEPDSKELFALDLENLGDLSRFLNWEISQLCTITDLANQLRRLIVSQEFRPILEVRRALEKLLPPQ